MMERYRKEDGQFRIDVSVREVRQLYDSRDPSPFHDRDLDENLVRYVVRSAEEIGEQEQLKIVINSPQLNDPQARDDFVLALHQYFEHEANAVRTELKHLFKQGRFSLIFSLLFLVICVFLALQFFGDSKVFNRVVHEGLIITGWVALWKPVNIFLYEWWPYRRKIRLFSHLAEIEVAFE